MCETHGGSWWLSAPPRSSAASLVARRSIIAEASATAFSRSHHLSKTRLSVATDDTAWVGLMAPICAFIWLPLESATQRRRKPCRPRDITRRRPIPRWRQWFTLPVKIRVMARTVNDRSPVSASDAGNRPQIRGEVKRQTVRQNAANVSARHFDLPSLVKYRGAAPNAKSEAGLITVPPGSVGGWFFPARRAYPKTPRGRPRRVGNARAMRRS